MCDEPHPLLIKDMLNHCVKADIDEAYKVLNYLGLFDQFSTRLDYCCQLRSIKVPQIFSLLKYTRGKFR